VINRTHVWKALWMDLTGVTAYECAQAAKKAKWPYFALTASGTRCIGLAAAPTQPKRNGGDHNFIADGPTRSMIVDTVNCRDSDAVYRLRQPLLSPAAVDTSGQAFGLLGKGKGARGKRHMAAERRGSDQGGAGGWLGR